MFAKGEHLTCTSAVKHPIELNDSTPVQQPHRRVPPNQVEEFRQHIQKLLDKGVIRQSSSEYASPVVLVRKKTGRNEDVCRLQGIECKDKT